MAVAYERKARHSVRGSSVFSLRRKGVWCCFWGPLMLTALTARGGLAFAVGRRGREGGEGDLGRRHVKKRRRGIRHVMDSLSFVPPDGTAYCHLHVQVHPIGRGTSRCGVGRLVDRRNNRAAAAGRLACVVRCCQGVAYLASGCMVWAVFWYSKGGEPKGIGKRRVEVGWVVPGAPQQREISRSLGANTDSLCHDLCNAAA